jgi:LysR family transcriptional activator of nhaA
VRDDAVAQLPPLRRSLEQWFEKQDIRPEVSGEFADSALLKAFGQAGIGVFPAPSVISKEICRQYRVREIGQLDGIRERYFAISVERRLKHPAIKAISEAARETLFA